MIALTEMIISTLSALIVPVKCVAQILCNDLSKKNDCSDRNNK